MIVRLRGILAERGDNRVIVDVNGVGYELLIPTAVEQRLTGVAEGDEISFCTLHYLQLDQNRATPVLIGFVEELERDFFERLLTVPKVGPKLALAMFALSPAEMSVAIEQGNMALLKELPGVGNQKAKDLVATLQGKLAKYIALAPAPELPAPTLSRELEAEALQTLIGFGHRKQEATRMIADALRDGGEFGDVESLVRAVYARRNAGQ